MKLRNLFATGIAGFGIWQLFRQLEQSNPTSLKNKVVVITGASSGIGRASAKIFAAQGAHTVLVARRANVLAEVQSELQKQFDTRVIIVAGDITQQEDINAIIKTTLDEFGRIDVLINNAGISKGGYLEEKDFDNWQSIIETNLSGVIRMTQAVLPLMKAQHSGHIVNVSSVVAFAGTPGQAVYTGTKSGVNGFSEALRREVFKDNIKVSIVMPGYTATPMNEDNLADITQDEATEKFINVESADYVASNIVAAVRYNKPQVILGGLQIQAVNWLHRLSPSIIDFIYTRVVDTENIIQATNTD